MIHWFQPVQIQRCIEPCRPDHQAPVGRKTTIEAVDLTMSLQRPRSMTVRSPSNLAAFLSLSIRRASSRPSQLWLSNIRCLPQNRFWQKPQSPTMGWAGALQASLKHRGLFDFFLVGVAGAGVDGLEVMSVDEEAGGGWSVGVELRIGGESCSVDNSSSFRSPTVLDGSKGLSSSVSRTSTGRVVEADRNSKTLETVWMGLTFSLMARDVCQQSV